MPSSLRWVDFAEDDRQKMMEILHLFKEKEIREELGVGTVRDAFSDMLFPGTSTLHTRAKYMLFIPWVFLSLENKLTPSEKIEELSRGYEIRLIKALLSAGEGDGVIGRVARDRLKILPSYMYWSSLGIWGIRRFDGSLYQYFHSLDGFYHHGKSQVKSDDGEVVSKAVHNWDPHIVPAPRDFPSTASLDLTQKEAEYLRYRILANCSGSLLAFLVGKTESTEADYVWMHPQVGDFTTRHRKLVLHARNLSDIMHGASLLYNLMLSEKSRNEEWIENYTQKAVDWSASLKDRLPEILIWDLNEFWRIVYEQNSHVPFMTRRFIDNWIALLRGIGNIGQLTQSDHARQLIYQREFRIKGKRSRLKNPRMLEHWSGTSAANPMDFRWHVSQRLIHDILNALRRK